MFEKADTRSSIQEGFLGFMEEDCLISSLNWQSTSSFLVHFDGSLLLTSIPKGTWYGHHPGPVFSLGCCWG